MACKGSNVFVGEDEKPSHRIGSCYIEPCKHRLRAWRSLDLAQEPSSGHSPLSSARRIVTQSGPSRCVSGMSGFEGFPDI